MIFYNITKCAEEPWTIEVTHGSISQLMKAIIGSGTKGIVKFFHKPVLGSMQVNRFSVKNFQGQKYPCAQTN